MTDNTYPVGTDLDNLPERDEDYCDGEEPKRSTYFYVSLDSIRILLGCKASAEQICAFIVAAKSRYSRSNYLTAGSNVISKCLGIRPQKAKRIYQALPTLVYQGNQLVRLTESKNTRYNIKLIDSGHQQAAIYFPSAFVGHKTAAKQYPVCKLCKAGDDATRLLLYIQGKLNTDLGGYLLSEESETSLLKVINGINVLCGTAPDFNIPDAVGKCVVAEGNVSHKVKGVIPWMLEIKEALDKLISLKLVESVVVAKVYKENIPTECWYDIHVQEDIIKGSVRDRIKKVAEEAGVSRGRKDGRSHDKVYHAIAPTGYTVRLCRVIRPVYRHTPSFDSDAISAEMHRDSNRYCMMTWLNVLEGNSRIDSIALPRCTPLLAHMPEALGPNPFNIDAMDYDTPLNTPKHEVTSFLSDEELDRFIEEGDAIIAAEQAEQQYTPLKPQSRPVTYTPQDDIDEDGY